MATPPMATPTALHAVVIAWNRPESLARLTRSLSGAEYPEDGRGANISVDFALDFTGNASTDAALDSIIHSFASTWKHGEVRVRRRRAHAGLRDNVLGAWEPSDTDQRPALHLVDVPANEHAIDLSRLQA